MTIAFNPNVTMINNDVNQPENNQRLRIVGGKLTLEDSSIRKEACWCSRFFTRGQYSQSAILEKMDRIYHKAMNPKDGKAPIVLSPVFFENYKILIERAQDQNLRHADSCCFTRFFAAKLEIDVTAHEANLSTFIAEGKKAAEHQANLDGEKACPKWETGDYPLEDMDELMDDPGFICAGYETILLHFPGVTLDTARTAGTAAKLAEFSGARMLQLLLEAIGLKTFGDCKAKGIFGPLTFIEYLKANREDLAPKIQALPFIEMKL